MLNLLTLSQAVLLILYWRKKIADPYSPDTLSQVLENENLKVDYFLTQIFLQNAIEAGELPALRKPKPKAEERKLQERAGVPEEMRDMLPKNYDTWITYDDLCVFVERPATISENIYTHSRDALARVAWMLIKKAEMSIEPANLQTDLDEIVIDLEEKGINCRLGESTLKSCVREILAAGDAIQEKQS